MYKIYDKVIKLICLLVWMLSGEVRAVEGISRTLSVGQVVWAPHPPTGSLEYLIFVGWSSENGFQQTPRKLGIKYCYNRPCSLYAIPSPFQKWVLVLNLDAVFYCQAIAILAQHGWLYWFEFEICMDHIP